MHASVGLLRQAKQSRLNPSIWIKSSQPSPHSGVEVIGVRVAAGHGCRYRHVLISLVAVVAE